MQEIDKLVFKCILVSILILLITSIVIADEEEFPTLTRGKMDATTPAFQKTEVQPPKAMPYNSVQKYANTLKGDDILSWRTESIKVASR